MPDHKKPAKLKDNPSVQEGIKAIGKRLQNASESEDSNMTDILVSLGTSKELLESVIEEAKNDAYPDRKQKT